MMVAIWTTIATPARNSNDSLVTVQPPFTKPTYRLGQVPDCDAMKQNGVQMRFL